MSDTESENSQERESLSNPEDDITQEEEAQEEETIEELLIAAEEGRINKDVDAVMGYISRLYEEKNKEKDRIIAELMVQLAIEKAEKNKLLKMNQPANKVSKKLQKKLKEKN